MAFDITSSYLINRARVNIADMQLEKMQNQAKPTELIERLADFVKKAEEESKEQGGETLPCGEGPRAWRTGGEGRQLFTSHA